MDLKFDANGLIPAIVQDHYTKEVLTLAYMNAESLAITIDEGRTCFFSRSRQELWRKGETSGNVQHVVSITADCDKDALASRVSVPIIASGGAGKMEDFAELFTHPGIDAGLAASIFHTRQVEIRELKRYLRTRGVEMRI